MARFFAALFAVALFSFSFHPASIAQGGEGGTNGGGSEGGGGAVGGRDAAGGRNGGDRSPEMNGSPPGSTGTDLSNVSGTGTPTGLGHPSNRHSPK